MAGMCVAELEGEFAEFSAKIIAANLLFDGPWFPPGHVDFRGMEWPNRFRGGTYNNTADRSRWKAIFGCREDAVSCMNTLMGMGIASEIVPPHLVEIDGNPETTISWWFTLNWSIIL